MNDPADNIIPWPWPAGGGDNRGGGPGSPGWRGGGGGWRRPGLAVVALASQKADSGKTTLAAHLAVQAELAGAGPVAVVDTDPEGSLAKWWDLRKEEFPAFAHTIAARLGEDLNRLRELGVKVCIVDTPPAITTAIEAVIENADLVMIPARPSPHDLRAAGATVELVERFGRRPLFVINKATPSARITAEAAIALSQHGTLAPVTVHQRVELAKAMEAGLTVMESDAKGEAAREIRDLWDCLAERLAKV